MYVQVQVQVQVQAHKVRKPAERTPTIAITGLKCTCKSSTKTKDAGGADNCKTPRGMHRQKLHRKNLQGMHRQGSMGVWIVCCVLDAWSVSGRVGRALPGTYFRV